MEQAPAHGAGATDANVGADIEAPDIPSGAGLEMFNPMGSASLHEPRHFGPPRLWGLEPLRRPPSAAD